MPGVGLVDDVVVVQRSDVDQLARHPAGDRLVAHDRLGVAGGGRQRRQQGPQALAARPHEVRRHLGHGLVVGLDRGQQPLLDPLAEARHAGEVEEGVGRGHGQTLVAPRRSPAHVSPARFAAGGVLVLDVATAMPSSCVLASDESDSTIHVRHFCGAPLGDLDESEKPPGDPGRPDDIGHTPLTSSALEFVRSAHDHRHRSPHHRLPPHARHLPPPRPLGAARLPAVARHHDVRRRLGLGRRRDRGPAHVRRLRRPRRQLRRHRQPVHAGHLRAVRRRLRQGPARPARDRHEVHDGRRARRPERRREPPQEHDALGRAEPRAAPDRLHRPSLPARLGRAHAGGRDPARPRRPGPVRQGALRGHLGHPGLAGRPHAGHR